MDKTIIGVLKEFYSEKNQDCLSIKPEEEPVIGNIIKKIISFNNNVVENKHDCLSIKPEEEPGITKIRAKIISFDTNVF